VAPKTNKKEYDGRVWGGLVWLQPAYKNAKELLDTKRGEEFCDQWENTSFSGRTLAYGVCAYV